MTDPAPTPPAPAPGPPPPDADARIGRLEAEQARQGGLLEEIKAALTGRGGGSNPPAPEPAQDAAAQVREGVAKIERERAEAADAAAAGQADKDWRANVERQLAERKPGEPATGRKAKLRRFLVGGDQ